MSDEEPKIRRADEVHHHRFGEDDFQEVHDAMDEGKYVVVEFPRWQRTKRAVKVLVLILLIVGIVWAIYTSRAPVNGDVCRDPDGSLYDC